MRSVDALLRAARTRVDAVDADLLLAHVLGVARAWLFAHRDDPVDAGDAARYEALVLRAARGEPVAHLTGTRGFWSMDLAVTPAVLVPRPETERLVEWALEAVREVRAPRIADLGTGSGAIALALARERPDARVVAIDASAAALEVARANAARLAIGNIEFRLGHWCAPLAADCFDLVAANPPYIREGDPHLSAGALPFEPRMALASGADGLDAIREIASCAAAHLVDGGWLGLEHGFDQGVEVRAILETRGWLDVQTRADLEDRDRITIARAG